MNKQNLTRLFLAAVMIVGLALGYQQAWAQQTPSDSTPSATQALKDRIEKVVEEKKESVEKKIKENAQKKRGFIGRIDRVSEEAITIQNPDGNQIIPVSPELTIVKDKEEVEVDQIAVDDWATVLGLMVDDNFQPVRMVVQANSLRTDPQVVMIGTLVSNTSKQLTLRSRLDQQEYQFVLNRSTDYQDNQGEEIGITDLFEEMQLLVVGFKEVDEDDDTETIRAAVVRSLAPIEE